MGTQEPKHLLKIPENSDKGEKSQHTLASGQADCLDRILSKECDAFPAGFFNQEEEKCLGRKSPTNATRTPKESRTNLGKVVNPPNLLA